ncbi:MAG: hypothetical protein KKD44_29335 [Proteobacteria bacterium]|nr:hypothetical protein [Pseudomonadota bacterium]
MSKRKTSLTIQKGDTDYTINFKRSDADMNRKSSEVIQELIQQIEGFRDWHKTEVHQ